MAGKTPKEWLSENGKTQDWLAEQLGVSQSTVNNLCNGRNSSFPILRKLHEFTNGEVTPNMVILGKPA